MSALEGFTLFDFDEGVPYMSVTKNGITFSKGVVMKMHYPTFVQLLINPDKKQIAIRACSEDDEKSIAFFKEDKKSKALSVRINVRDLLNTILDMTEWNLNQYSCRIDGTLIKEEPAMIFDLNDPRKLMYAPQHGCMV